MRFFLLFLLMLSITALSQKISTKYLDQCMGEVDSVNAYLKIVSDYSEDSVFCKKYEYQEGKLVGIMNFKRADSLDWTGHHSKPQLQLHKVSELVYYRESGAKYAEVKFVNSKLQDTLKLYYPDGKLKRWSFCRGDSIIESECFTNSGEKISCQPLMKDGEFPSGSDEMSAFLGKNLVYPQEALRQERGGTVYIKFCVSETGKVSNFRVIKSSGSEDLDAEALRVISMIPNWGVSIQYEMRVVSEQIIPLRFVIPDEDDDNRSNRKRKRN